MSWGKMALIAFATLVVPAIAQGQEPGWSPSVIALGTQREEIRSTDILHRPYRPMHFYGNTVRRRHYRGTAVPRPFTVVAR